ncbi:uncharacterized protein GGS22DRAFT_197674 [Annulohypoxylon maeteangense]|uniref:uncharacterized protein n=1 Tax=Annulohypoxylon maeteangense TaxID=1927788 RepID=UPI00200884FD|nr:uncharacterized protein GGS22DRAFT_197674 [Annulohypoxylon maeteangense]KAI0880266.1 hypothetical protein GGS22DRAFT_197674 [Annulohypoxylon maeteangense]
MNWTEGNLSRHSRGRQRNELLTRQKQHFAKVRNGLLSSGVKQSPVSISFLGTQNSRGSGRHNSSSSVVHKPLSSPLLGEKRKRAPNVSDDSEYQLSICEKRKRLLDQEDWVGLNLQQPIDITFPGQLHPYVGSRWSKSGRTKPPTAQRRRNPPSSPRLEVARESRDLPVKIQIGSQEINPSTSTVSRRYSLAPHPLASSSQIRSNPISSPQPSHARHRYMAPTRNNMSPQIPKDILYGTTGDHCSTYSREPVRSPVLEEPTYIVHSSSIIHEPVPCRKHSNFMVLDWSPTPSEPEDWGSMQVEIERPARPAPSQEADQEFWKDLVPSSSDNLPIDISANNYQVLALSSTPETNVLPSNLHSRLPSYDISSEPAASISYQFPDSSTNSNSGSQIAACRHDAIMLLKNEPSHQKTSIQPEDDNSAWMKFVFDDDSEELEAKAFMEAAHQAAAELVPSDSSRSVMNSIETSTACGVDSFDQDEEENDSACLLRLGENDVATQGVLDLEGGSSNIATAGSTTVTESESRFRFAQPRTFVGKLSDSNTTATQNSTLVSCHREKKRGRPKKKAADGRTDIRQLPDFDGDPIEEFED